MRVIEKVRVDALKKSDIILDEYGRERRVSYSAPFSVAGILHVISFYSDSLFVSHTTRYLPSDTIVDRVKKELTPGRSLRRLGSFEHLEPR